MDFLHYRFMIPGAVIRVSNPINSVIALTGDINVFNA